MNVLNVAPTATFNAPPSVSEGSPIAVSLTTPVDVPADLGSLQYAFDCGAGYGPFGAANTVSCPTVDNGTLDVGGKVKDKDGGVSEYIATVTIYNVPPDVAVPVVSPEPSTEGGSVTASATFTDPGVNDAPFTCTVDYGDGSGALAGTVSGHTCTGPAHVYSTIGGYPVTISVTDKDGSTGRRVAMHTGDLQLVRILPAGRQPACAQRGQGRQRHSGQVRPGWRQRPEHLRGGLPSEHADCLRYVRAAGRHRADS